MPVVTKTARAQILKYEVRRTCGKSSGTVSSDVSQSLVVLGIEDPVLEAFCKLNWTLKEKVGRR